MSTPRAVSDVVGYVRVSTGQQGESGAGLDAQESAIRAECERRGWELLTPLYRDVASGKSRRRREDLDAALARLHRGEAQALVVAKLDRLSRSLVDFADLMAVATEEGWAIVALDIGVDTSTVNGELVASIIMALAQWERRMIGQRTKDGLGALQARGKRLGRPSTTPPEAEALIRVLSQLDGGGKPRHGVRQIARLLNEQQIPTPQGGTEWRASTVSAVAQRLARAASNGSNGSEAAAETASPVVTPTP